MEIEKQIERLVLEDSDFQQLEAEFNCFCPFEAMGMVRAEIRHGNLLAYLLDPFRPHGFETRILRCFLMAVARHATIPAHTEALRPLDVHLLDLQDAEVRREWRNIDLLIILSSAKLVIPIELKIDASQGNEQLKRYRKIIEEAWPKDEGWRHISVFLSKRDEEPEDGDHWSPLALSAVAAELEGLNKSSVGVSTAAPLLESYLRMLRRHHLEDDRLDNLARKLWSRHGEALAFLADNRPDAVGNLFASLRDRRQDIAERISGPNRGMAPDFDQTNVLRFGFKPWDELPGFRSAQWTETKRLILLELKREGTKLVAYLYLGPGQSNDRERYWSAVEGARLHRPTSRPGREWMCLAKSEIFKSKENDEIDVEVSIELVISALSAFSANVFQHFDPILSRMDRTTSASAESELTS
ncbi:PD-(D/E)XK nuclease family protein [Kaistia sp. UC242_56]|uniref:PD-(D/E)XK nuclease family protein n=1 Tax=Kaistia sp. UC242_56 TaxID=3374625 RepID=UPI0037A95F80